MTCDDYKFCKNRDPKSYTCRTVGGDYCGVWRNRRSEQSSINQAFFETRIALAKAIGRTEKQATTQHS